MIWYKNIIKNIYLNFKIACCIWEINKWININSNWDSIRTGLFFNLSILLETQIDCELIAFLYLNTVLKFGEQSIGEGKLVKTMEKLVPDTEN